MTIYDLIIIGGGPAGMSAGIYAARKKIKALLITKSLGGQATEAWQIENYLGFGQISSAELIKNFTGHLFKFKNDLEIKEGEAAVIIEKKNELFEITTDKNKYQSRTILVASGVVPKRLGVPGEEEFIGRGVVFCATCDAPLFSGKTVAVVGAGNSGLSATLQLTKYAKKIYLINKYSDLLKGDMQYAQQVKDSLLVEIITDSMPAKIKGETFVTSLAIKNVQTGKIKELAVDGVFVEIGAVPALHFVKSLIKYNQKDEIIIDPKTNMASCPGIFAAGDVTDIPHKQVIIAAGEGAKAALSVYDYIIKNR